MQTPLQKNTHCVVNVKDCRKRKEELISTTIPNRFAIDSQSKNKKPRISKNDGIL